MLTSQQSQVGSAELKHTHMLIHSCTCTHTHTDTHSHSYHQHLFHCWVLVPVSGLYMDTSLSKVHSWHAGSVFLVCTSCPVQLCSDSSLPLWEGTGWLCYPKELCCPSLSPGQPTPTPFPPTVSITRHYCFWNFFLAVLFT